MGQEINLVEFLDLPVAAPPPGVLPNFDHPQSRAFEAHVGMGICIAITSIVVLLRIYVKLCITHFFGWDDCACLMGYALFLAFNIMTFIILGPLGYFGRHIWEIKLKNITKFSLQCILATINLWVAAAFFVKLSLFLLYFRLFKPSRQTRWLIYGGIAACGLFYSIIIIVNSVLSSPTASQLNDWNSWLLRLQKSQQPLERLALAQSIFGTISDVYLLVIPLQTIFQLHLSTKRKLGISAIFMIGTLAVACSIINLGYRIRQFNERDSTWFGVPVFIVSCAELSAGIICSCMPIVAKLFRDKTGQNFNFPSLRFITSFFTSITSQRPFAFNRTPSSNISTPKKSSKSSESETKKYIQLENGGQQ